MAVTKNSAGAKTVDTKNVKLSDVPGIPDTEGMQIDNLAPATDVAASGALMEPAIADRIDTTHPAVDDEPRKGVSIESNQIDFNDPTLTLSEQVMQNLVENNLKAPAKDA